MVIHRWEDGTIFYTDDEGNYKLDYKGKTSNISIVRTGIMNIAISDDKDVPKTLLAEISHNL